MTIVNIQINLSVQHISTVEEDVAAQRESISIEEYIKNRAQISPEQYLLVPFFRAAPKVNQQWLVSAAGITVIRQ